MEGDRVHQVTLSRIHRLPSQELQETRSPETGTKSLLETETEIHNVLGLTY